MYEKFYGFTERPFALTPDAAFLYLSRQHRHALTMLEYAVMNRVGFALVTGEIGSGKTTLVRHLIDNADGAAAIHVVNVHRAFGSLLPWIARAVGVAAPAREAPELYAAFLQRLAAGHVEGKRVVIIVDEAQNLGPKTLEELRVLSNINLGKEMLLQTILVGQPELRETLGRPGMRQFAQRIAIDYHLTNLNQLETRAYVRHRLQVAGGAPDLMAVEAIDLAFLYTAGVPRLLNILCDMALVYGFADEKPTIDRELMAQVIEERLAGGLLPLREVTLPPGRLSGNAAT